MLLPVGVWVPPLQHLHSRLPHSSSISHLFSPFLLPNLPPVMSLICHLRFQTLFAQRNLCNEQRTVGVWRSVGYPKKRRLGGLLSFITCKSKSAMNCLPIAYQPCLSAPPYPSQYSLSLSATISHSQLTQEHSRQSSLDFQCLHLRL